MTIKQLPHADVIKHMAEHGYESVECYAPHGNLDIWKAGSFRVNPITHNAYEWRIKPVVTPLVIADFPYPETEPPPVGTQYHVLSLESSDQTFNWVEDGWDLRLLKTGCVYLDKDKRDRANELLMAALRGGK